MNSGSLKYDGKTDSVTDTRRLMFNGHNVSFNFLFCLKATSALQEAPFEVVISLTYKEPAIAGTREQG